jgi:MtN3 and saliva related transmembrane protein
VSFVEILGLVAGAITTGSFFPQVIRVYKLHSAREISLFFTILFLVGDFTWMTYGIYLQQLPIILWNILGGLLAAALLFAKIKYGQSAKCADDLPSGKTEAK